MSDYTVEEVLRKAVEILDERGWHQGYYRHIPTGRLCSIGACAEALDVNPSEPTPMFNRVWTFLDDYVERKFERPGSFVAWQDKDGRTVDEVKALLLAAADEVVSRCPVS
jgi:hypothetical protein